MTAMRISLVPVDLCDAMGAPYRFVEDIRQLGLRSNITEPPAGFVDFGLVNWKGVDYYMSAYTAPYEDRAESIEE